MWGPPCCSLFVVADTCFVWHLCCLLNATHLGPRTFSDATQCYVWDHASFSNATQCCCVCAKWRKGGFVTRICSVHCPPLFLILLICASVKLNDATVPFLICETHGDPCWTTSSTSSTTSTIFFLPNLVPSTGWGPAERAFPFGGSLSGGPLFGGAEAAERFDPSLSSVVFHWTAGGGRRTVAVAFSLSLRWKRGRCVLGVCVEDVCGGAGSDGQKMGRNGSGSAGLQCRAYRTGAAGQG